MNNVIDLHGDSQPTTEELVQHVVDAKLREVVIVGINDEDETVGIHNFADLNVMIGAMEAYKHFRLHELLNGVE